MFHKLYFTEREMYIKQLINNLYFKKNKKNKCIIAGICLYNVVSVSYCLIAVN